jgi:hypothetical protein
VQERQDIDRLVSIADDYEHRIREGLTERRAEAPVHVVVKSPCIALRYPVTPATVSFLSSLMPMTVLSGSHKSVLGTITRWCAK